MRKLLLACMILTVGSNAAVREPFVYDPYEGDIAKRNDAMKAEITDASFVLIMSWGRGGYNMPHQVYMSLNDCMEGMIVHPLYFTYELGTDDYSDVVEFNCVKPQAAKFLTNTIMEWYKDGTINKTSTKSPID